MKTSKRGRKKLKCRHEAIAGLFLYEEEEDGGEPLSEKTCSNCQKNYSESGGQCKYCTTTVSYCSKKCQVKEKTIII